MEEKIKKYLGVDWGEKRIGLALGDSLLKIATPFKTVGDPARLLEVVEEEGIDILVVGKPLKLLEEEGASRNKKFYV